MGADVPLGRDPWPSEASQEPFSASWEVVSPSGDVDVMTAPALLDSVLDASMRCGLGVVVDFAAVTFVDSAGVEALELARSALAPSGCRLMVRHPSRLLVQMLGLFDLSDVIEPLTSKLAPDVLGLSDVPRRSRGSSHG